MLETLGINPIHLIGQIIAFGIVFFVLSKYLFPQVRTALQERRDAVSKTFADQASIENRLREFDVEQKAAQKQAAEEIHKLIAEAKESAALTKQELVAKAKESAAAELAAAEKRIEQEKINAEAEVAKYAKTIAQSIVDEILSTKAADSKWQESQLKASLESLKQAQD
jgi:F-type H+-transporting ATPase subunit b